MESNMATSIDQAALQTVRERRLLIDRLDGWLFNQTKAHLGQRILEIGCGVGNMAPHLTDRELVLGIDIDDASVDSVNREYAGSCISATVIDASSDEMLALKRHHFDSAISINVLEHVEHDLRALTLIRQVLQPDGTLVLVVPAHRALYGTMDSPIGHWRRYGVCDLRTKLECAGFDVLQVKTINPLGALGWFVNGRLLRRRVPPEGQLRLFNLLYPLMLLMDALRLPFGLSVLAVAQARAA
jgi:SAM-dependent methyltransferase